MSGFLTQMAASSAARSAAAQRIESLASLSARIADVPPPPRLTLSPAGFDVIAELKLRSPAQGILGNAADDWQARVLAYAKAGAAAVSVLTEPTRFDGSLEHLRQAAALLAPESTPAMRKDFLVDAYQLYEARAAGAGGVLLILRMLDAGRIALLLDVAAELGLFVLLEAFDKADLERAASLAATRNVHAQPILVGINCRDLQSLHVVPERLVQLAPLLPNNWPAVAESGVATPADARRMSQHGYKLALIGTALMAAANPGSLLRDMLKAARTALP
jgi:indole-3-glycerol phosphate synthase